MDLIELLKVYGPLGLGWIVALYLGRFILGRYDKDLDTKTELAHSLKEHTDGVRELKERVIELTHLIRELR
jgi:hypothetical protein